MCGINGIISLHPSEKLSDRISKMNLAISHRGPDHDDYLVLQDSVALGHRRLSIIDLDSRANQPMVSNNSNFVIVYNGEIFNYRDIKSHLIDKYDFHTDSDTEVILASTQIYGIEWFLSRAIGMFAFALFDIKSNYLYLVRDRFGIKPLYYYLSSELLVFSSEIKGILSSGLVEADFYEEMIDEYLGNRYIREPNTFFKGIMQVESSSYIAVDADFNTSIIKYWELPKMNFKVDFEESEIVESTNHQVETALSRWFIADVKVGAYLSGGLDSSLTTAILAKKTDIPVNTYTIGFHDEGFNEFEFSRIVSKLYSTVHHEILLNSDSFLDDWDKLIWYKDAPLGVPNEIPLAIMTKNLSKDITVVISGEGADELFGGYGRIFRSPFDFENLKPLKSDFYKYFINLYEYVPRGLRDKYLNISSTVREEYDGLISEDFRNFSNEENVFRYFHNYHIKGLLQRVDMTTMQASVEGRPPFLDHRLIEYVYKEVPYDLKLKWQSTKAKENAKHSYANKYSEVHDIPKYILKRIAERYLPNDIVYRKKVGFPVPLTNWYQNLSSIAEFELINSHWLKRDLLSNLLMDCRDLDRAGQILWMFVNIQLFYKKYFTKSWLWN